MGMNTTEKVINDLNTSKRILCYPQMLNPEMCIKIGLAITDALALLKEQEAVVWCKDCKHLFDGEHTKNCCDVLMGKAGWLKEISVSPDWFCADGERR